MKRCCEQWLSNYMQSNCIPPCLVFCRTNYHCKRRNSILPASNFLIYLISLFKEILLCVQLNQLSDPLLGSICNPLESNFTENYYASLFESMHSHCYLFRWGFIFVSCAPKNESFIIWTVSTHISWGEAGEEETIWWGYTLSFYFSLTHFTL